MGARYSVKVGDFDCSRELYAADYCRLEELTGMRLGGPPRYQAIQSPSLPIRWLAWESLLLV